MSEVVVDTNVWVMPTAGDTEYHRLLCAQICRQWLSELYDSKDLQIVADMQGQILKEYWRNIPKGSFASGLLAQLQKQAGRIVWVRIQLESDGETAVLPAELGLEGFDRSDRKFLAVSLALNPHPPVYNAVDPDYQEHLEALNAAGIKVEELCPNALTGARGAMSV